MTANDASPEEAQVHARIAHRLAELAGDSLAMGGSPHPYVRRHLVEHAQAGHCLTDAVLHPTFLPWESSGTVRGRVGLPPPVEPGNVGLAAWAGVEAAVTGWAIEDRTASLRLARAAHDLPVDDAGNEPLTARWAHWPTTNNVLCHTHAHCLASFTAADGTPRVATGHTDGSLRVWDPATGTQDGPALTGHTGAVTGIAVYTTADGRPRLATTSSDRTVRVWDPATGTQDGPALTGHTRRVTGIAVYTTADGRPRLATTSTDTTVRVWDPATGTQDGPALTGHTRRVTGIAVYTTADGRPRLATTSWDKTVRVWDPATGTQDACVATGSPVECVAVDPDDTYLIVGGPEGRLARLALRAGRREEAVAPAEESVDFYRELVAVNRSAYLPDLARSLWAVSWICDTTGVDLERGISAGTEAVLLYADLVHAHPAVDQRQLAAATATLESVKAKLRADGQSTSD